MYRSLPLVLVLLMPFGQSVRAQEQSHSNHGILLEFAAKSGIAKMLPTHSGVEGETEMRYELEVNLEVDHLVLSAFGGTCVPGQSHEETKKALEAGVLLGYSWPFEHSVIEVKAGMGVLSGSYSTATYGSNLADIQMRNKVYRATEGLFDVCWKYHVRGPLTMGLDVPITVNKHLYSYGLCYSLAYDLHI